jgi:hypothetical protein
LRETHLFDVKLTKSGILSSTLVQNADKHQKISLEVGQEYYIVIYTPIRPSQAKSSAYGFDMDKVFFGVTNKDVFENEGRHSK